MFEILIKISLFEEVFGNLPEFPRKYPATGGFAYFVIMEFRDFTF